MYGIKLSSLLDTYQIGHDLLIFCSSNFLPVA